MAYPHWWNETITRYRKTRERDEEGKTKTSWQSEVLRNCFWGETQSHGFRDNTLSTQNTLVVRIPAKECAPLNIGDIVIRGEVYDDIPVNGSGTELINKFKGLAFVINTAKDNSKLRNAHYFGGES